MKRPDTFKNLLVELDHDTKEERRKNFSYNLVSLITINYAILTSTFYYYYYFLMPEAACF